MKITELNKNYKTNGILGIGGSLTDFEQTNYNGYRPIEFMLNSDHKFTTEEFIYVLQKTKLNVITQNEKDFFSYIFKNPKLLHKLNDISNNTLFSIIQPYQSHFQNQFLNHLDSISSTNCKHDNEYSNFVSIYIETLTHNKIINFEHLYFKCKRNNLLEFVSYSSFFNITKQFHAQSKHGMLLEIKNYLQKNKPEYIVDIYAKNSENLDFYFLQSEEYIKKNIFPISTNSPANSLEIKESKQKDLNFKKMSTFQAFKFINAKDIKDLNLLEKNIHLIKESNFDFQKKDKNNNNLLHICLYQYFKKNISEEQLLLIYNNLKDKVDFQQKNSFGYHIPDLILLNQVKIPSEEINSIIENSKSFNGKILNTIFSIKNEYLYLDKKQIYDVILKTDLKQIDLNEKTITFFKDIIIENQNYLKEKKFRKKII